MLSHTVSKISWSNCQIFAIKSGVPLKYMSLRQTPKFQTVIDKQMDRWIDRNSRSKCHTAWPKMNYGHIPNVVSKITQKYANKWMYLNSA